MTKINDVINWILNSGLLVWLFYFGLVIVKPWVDNKIKHAKTVQQQQAWQLLEQVSETMVASLVHADMTGSQKFNQASQQVQNYLTSKGIHIDTDTIQNAVQAAYEKSDLTGSNSNKTDPVLEAIETAPNRANDVQKVGDN